MRDLRIHGTVVTGPGGRRVDNPTSSVLVRPPATKE
jgi:hypothetical protein